MFSSNINYKGEVGTDRRESDGTESATERVQRLLLIRVFRVCFFFYSACSSITLSHSRDSVVESKDSHWEKAEKGARFSFPLARKEKKKVEILCLFWGRGCAHRSCLVHVFSSALLCFQMERMQGEGEMGHLEPPSPLTDKERVMIRDSWTKVYETCDDVGVAILVRYFSLWNITEFIFILFRHKMNCRSWGRMHFACASSPSTKVYMYPSCC